MQKALQLQSLWDSVIGQNFYKYSESVTALKNLFQTSGKIVRSTRSTI